MAALFAGVENSHPQPISQSTKRRFGRSTMNNKIFRNGIFFLLTVFLILQLSGIALGYSDTSDLFFDDPFYQDDYDPSPDLFFDGSEPVVLEDQTEFLPEPEISGLEDPEAILPDAEDDDPILPDVEDAETITPDGEDTEPALPGSEDAEPIFPDIEDAAPILPDPQAPDLVIYEEETSETEMIGTEPPEILMLEPDSSETEMSQATSPVITEQPAAMYGSYDDTVSCSVSAQGIVDYYWQYSKDGGKSWIDSNTWKATYSVKISRDQYHFQYRCVVTDVNGQYAISNTAPLIILPKITRQPDSVSVPEGNTVTFRCGESGYKVSCQWQYSEDGGNTWINSWKDPGVYTYGQTSFYQITASQEYENRQFRCIVTDEEGHTAISEPAVLTLVKEFSITEQPPEICAGSNGDTVNWSVCTNSDGLSYQWQCSTDGGATWNNVSSGTRRYYHNSYDNNRGYSYFGLYIYPEDHNSQYRCVISNGSGQTIVSRAVTVLFNTKFLKQPSSVLNAGYGSTVSFHAEAVGAGVKLQWQYSKDGGTTWINSSVTNAMDYYTTADDLHDGFYYRCAATNVDGDVVYSQAALLSISQTIKNLTITKVSGDVSVGLGETARFNVTAVSPRSDLRYLWRYSKDSGATWISSTVRTPYYAVTVHKVHDGFLYQCIVQDGRNLKTSQVMSLSVVPRITIQPVSMTTTVGGSASFEAQAIGIGPLTYQWQYSTEKKKKKKNSGTRKPVYTNGSVGKIHNQFQYRCLITSANGTSVTTKVATLTVLS